MKKVLPDKLRNKIKEVLCDLMLQTMFDDGQETEYIMDGVEIKGLNHRTDQELLYELEMSCNPEDLDPDDIIDDLYARAKRAMEQ